MSTSKITRRLAGILMLAAFLRAPEARAENLVIPGSGSPEHVLGLLAQAFNDRQSTHRISVPGSIGTAGGLREVESGSSRLGRVGRPLKPDERARGLVYVPLGRDPVVFVAGAGVEVRSVSAAQVVDIYAGRIVDWSALGGRGGPIRVIGRESSDTSRQAIQRVIKPFESMVFDPAVKVVHLDPQMIELLDRYPGSLGFVNRSALAACRTPVVVLALDGVEPTRANVDAGRYPLWLEFGLVHKGDPGAAGRAFIDFVRSPQGQTILREQGVRPVSGVD